MGKQAQRQSDGRQKLKEARAALAAAATRAMKAGILSPDDTCRVRLALKRGRSYRTSAAGLSFAARQCAHLAHELDSHMTDAQNRERV
jgi:hypothetical protein